MNKKLYYYATTQDACLEAIAFGAVRVPVHGALVLSDTVAGILMLKALNQEEKRFGPNPGGDGRRSGYADSDLFAFLRR